MGVRSVDVNCLPWQAGHVTDVLAHGIEHLFDNTAVVHTQQNSFRSTCLQRQSIDFQLIQNAIRLTGNKIAGHTDAQHRRHIDPCKSGLQCIHTICDLLAKLV